MSEKRPILEVKNLTLGLKKQTLEVVKDISFKIMPGETVALLGESGAGKSTLFKAILQLLKNSDWQGQGSIQIDGREVMGLHPKELESLRGQLVRCILQEPALVLNPSLKVDRQLAEAILVTEPGIEPAVVDARMHETLRLSGLDPQLVLGRFPGDLSGGQRQRVGVAMSLCAASPLLLADEPSNSLDSVTVYELVQTLLKLKDTGHIGALLIVTHDLGVLKALNCQRVLFMDDGHLYEAGSIQNVVANPVHPKLAEIVSLMNVIDQLERQTPHDADHEAPLVDGRGLNFGYRTRSFLKRGKTQALHSVDFQLAKNEFVALVGNSGSGKSTLGKLVTRELMEFEGSLSFNGKELGPKERPTSEFRRQVQTIFQEPADTFDPSLTMGENMAESFSAMGVTNLELEGIFDELLDQLLLDRRMLGELPGNLSGGQKQRFALMRAFGSHPKLLLADEPFNNLDLIAQQRLIELLLTRKADQQSPLSCILISHDIGVVSKLCERVFVVSRGRIVESGPVEQVIQDPTHEATKRLIQAARALGSIESNTGL
ncbi:MAG: ATP-binding cassette domain-containing protein [bacterium]|nr:ATP-binding cassette domain-containing protein [bacterium]